MKRSAVWLLLSCCALGALATDAQAGKLFDKIKQQRTEYPPRYTRGSMAQWYVSRDKQGQVHYRQAYPGYGAHFPPPAYLEYGYPKSGYWSGLGVAGYGQ